jgi:hypothetical protein
MTRSWITGIRKSISTLKFSDLAWAYRQRRHTSAPVMHRKLLANIRVPDKMLLPLLCGKRPRRRPPELSILLVHNYKSPPIMERSLRYLGIDDFDVACPNITPWRHSWKIKAIAEYLRTRCATEYVLYVDANDAVLTGDPARFVPLLKEYDCDLLFSSTHYKGGYECMPEIKRWADQRCREAGFERSYLNTGVFLGRREFTREVFEAATVYVDAEDLTPEEFTKRRAKGQLCKTLPEFPKNVGADQVIISYLEPRFYPRLKVDYSGKLAIRARSKRSFRWNGTHS